MSSPLPDCSQVVAVDVTDTDTLNVLKGLGISQMADLTSVRTNLTALEHPSLVSLVRLAPTYISPASPGIPQSNDCQPGLHGQTRWLWKPHCQLHGQLGLLARVVSYLFGDQLSGVFFFPSDFATAALPQPIAKASELIEFAVFAAAPTLEYEVVRQRWFLNCLLRFALFTTPPSCNKPGQRRRIPSRASHERHKCQGPKRRRHGLGAGGAVRYQR